MMPGWPHPAPENDAAASHLKVGRRLPDILLRATDESELSLAELPGRWVVFIYPWAGRPGVPNPPNWDSIPGAHGSTPEAIGFRDHYDHFKMNGINVLGLSGQSTQGQQELAERLQLPFLLLSDAEGALRDAMRLPSFATGGVNYLKRLTLVLKDGCIERVCYPVHPPDDHARELLSTLSLRG